MKRDRIARVAGFTLIELLVVVAVIALLAALLFPVFAQAREKARQAMCLSNLKQIGAAVTMYAQDYHETYPSADIDAMLVPGPEGSWGKIPTLSGFDAARSSVAVRLQPYVRSAQIFLCPSDPQGVRSFGPNYVEPRFARGSYRWHVTGLSLGVSWPEFPVGKWTATLEPLTFAEVSRPTLLQMAWDGWQGLHSRVEPGEACWNVCYADGHVRFSRFIDFWVAQKQRPWAWNQYNPQRPVNIETPCSPTCADEAARD